MVVYVLSYVVEYESSRVLGVFNSFDAALAEARRDNEDNGQPELKDFGRGNFGGGICYEPFKDNYCFYRIDDYEVKGERNDN